MAVILIFYLAGVGGAGAGTRSIIPQRPFKPSMTSERGLDKYAIVLERPGLMFICDQDFKPSTFCLIFFLVKVV